MTEKELPGKDPIKVIVLGILASLVIRFLYYTNRKRFSGQEHLTRFMESGEPVIIVSWHNRNLLGMHGYLKFRTKGRKITPLASASKDGGLVDWAMRTFGIRCVRGSSSRGGFTALKQMMKAVKSGSDVAFTPDGPRGPLYTVQGGVITTAKMTGAPIVPIAFQASRRKELNSWDRMIVPAPFGRVNYVYGEPFFVPRDCPAKDIEIYAEKLREQMLELNEQAERF